MKRNKSALFRMLFMMLLTVVLVSEAALNYAFAYDYSQYDLIYDDYSYNVLSEGGVEITRYNGHSKKLIIPDKIDGMTVVSIGDYAFNENSDIVKVKLPETIKSIGTAAFEGCSFLKDINLPDSLEKIDSLAFYNCDSLYRLNVPSSVKEFGSLAFQGTLWLENKKDKAKNDFVIINETLIDGTNCTGSVNIPKSVKKIAGGAFTLNNDITSVTIPSTIKSLDAMTFYGCSGLKKMTIPKSVVDIDPTAFTNTPWYENKTKAAKNGLIIVNGVLLDASNAKGKVTIPSSVTSIATNSFVFNKEITEVTIPKSVTFIGSEAFYGCYNLKKVNIKASLITIEDGTFGSCNNLETINLPKNLIHIGEEAFSSCAGLKKITFPSSLKTIGKKAFYGCYGIAEVKLPEDIIKIDDSAFGNCKSLMKVEMPDFKGILSSSAFMGTPWLADAAKNSPDGMLIIGDSLIYVSPELEEISIPSNVKEIGPAFYGNNNIKKVVIPSTVEYISDYAFYMSRVEELVIPKSIKKIGKNSLPINLLTNTKVIYEGSEEDFKKLGADLTYITVEYKK